MTYKIVSELTPVKGQKNCWKTKFTDLNSEGRFWLIVQLTKTSESRASAYVLDGPDNYKNKILSVEIQAIVRTHIGEDYVQHETCYLKPVEEWGMGDILLDTAKSISPDRTIELTEN